MAFGLSFGGNKKKIDTLSTINRNESGTQTGTESTNSTQTSNNQTNSSTTGSQTSAQQQTNASQQASTQQGTQATDNISRLFGAETFESLDASVRDLLTQATSGAAGPIDQFDEAGFVSGVVADANARNNDVLDGQLGSLFSSTGGNASTNTMAALLGNRLANNNAANIAGIQSNAQATAEGITRDNAVANRSIQAQDDNLLTQLTGLLRGGVTTETGQAVTSQAGTQTGSETGSTTGTQSSAQQTASESQTVEALTQILSSLLNTNTVTTGSERTTGSESSKGGGFGLSL